MNVKQRHKLADKRLQTLAPKVFELKNSKKELDRMGNKYGVTGQTIRNYIMGFGSDGFLKEALIREILGNDGRG